jgi:hypothetical protein
MSGFADVRKGGILACAMALALPAAALADHIEFQIRNERLLVKSVDTAKYPDADELIVLSINSPARRRILKEEEWGSPPLYRRPGP